MNFQAGVQPEKRVVRYGGAMMGQEEIDAVVNVMKTSMVVGEKVQTFEKRCAKLLGKEYGIMTNSGSSALLLAMRLLDLPQGSEVITPTCTFGTDISSICLAGYVPVFVDVVLDTYQIDIDKIERLFNIELEDDDYTTVAGMITSEAGYVPKTGETLMLRGLEARILRSDEKKVGLVRLRKYNEEQIADHADQASRAS